MVHVQFLSGLASHSYSYDARQIFRDNNISVRLQKYYNTALYFSFMTVFLKFMTWT